MARSFEYFNEKSPLGAGLSNQGKFHSPSCSLLFPLFPPFPPFPPCFSIIINFLLGATCYVNSLLQVSTTTTHIVVHSNYILFVRPYITPQSSEVRYTNGRVTPLSILHFASLYNYKNFLLECSLDLPILLRYTLHLLSFQYIFLSRPSLYSINVLTQTKQLTNSFGWEESDAFEQHDVQGMH